MLLDADILPVFGEAAFFGDATTPGLCYLSPGFCRDLPFNLLREQVFIVVFVQHGLHVELLAVGQLLAYLARVNGLHTDIDLGGLGPGELGLLPLLLQVSLLKVAQRPERIELDLQLGDFIDLAGGESGLEDDGQQIPQVALEHPALNTLDVVVVVLHAGVVGGAHTANSLAKQDGLRDVGECGQHIAGRTYHIIDAGELEGLEVVVLALGVDDKAVQKPPGEVNHLEALQHLVLAFLCGQLLCQVLHLVDGLDGAIQQLWGAAVCDLRIPQGLIEPDVLRDAPELVDRVRGVFRQDAVLKNEAPAVMDCKAPVLAEYLVVFRQAQAASPCAERISRVVVEQRRVVGLDNRAVKYPDVIDGLDVAPVERFIQATPVIDKHDRQGATKEAGPFQAGDGGFVPVQFVQGLGVEVLDLLIRDVLQREAVLDGLLGRGVDDLGEQAIPFVVHGQQLVGDGALRDVLVLLGRVLLSTIPGHHVHIAISTKRPHRLAGLLQDQVVVASDAVELGHFRFSHAVLHLSPVS